MLYLSDDEVRRRLAPGGEVRHDVSYEGLEHLTEIYNPSVFPGRVYVRDGAVQLVYIPSGAALENVSMDDLEAQLGGEGVPLRSRAGKVFGHYVHADKGVAYSANEEEVAFIEVFPPRSHDAYLADIYREPGPFIR